MKDGVIISLAGLALMLYTFLLIPAYILLKKGHGKFPSLGKYKLLYSVQLLFALMVLVCCFSMGCMTTMTWESAKRPMCCPTVKGYVSNSATTDSKRIDILMVSYISDSKWPQKSKQYSYAIQCNGSITNTGLAYQGKSRASGEIVANTNASSMKTMENNIFSDHAEQLSLEIAKSGAFHEQKELVIGNDLDSQLKWDWDKNIALVPYWWKQNGGPSEKYIWWQHGSNFDDTLDSKCELLVLPYHLPKKKIDYFKDATIATVETPFALIADMALFPFELVYFFGYLHA